MLLAELGDRKVKVRFTRNDDRVLDAEADIGDRKIEFSAVYFDQYWNVVFSEAKYDEETQEWSHAGVEATGSGREFEVLSMIATCMKELLKKNPQAIKFTADKSGAERKRVSIYRRIGDKLLKGFDREEEDVGKEIEFRYTKSAKDIEL